jgi:hypothetical protein
MTTPELQPAAPKPDDAMKRPPKLKWLSVLGVASLWFLFPSEARADGINIGFVAVAGLVVLVPLMAFEVFVEAIVLAIGLKLPYRKVLLLSFAANLASLAAGIPVKIFNAWMYPNILPHELAPYFREFPRAAFLGMAIYFVVTVLVEFLVVVWWCRKHAAAVSLCRASLRFNRSQWWGGDDWGVSFSDDESGGKKAMTYSGLESHLRVKTDDGSTIVLADNPGLLHLPSRSFGDVCFLGNGSELVFDDYQDIYLLNLAQRKVGWIAHGSKVVMLTPRYQTKILDVQK